MNEASGSAQRRFRAAFMRGGTSKGLFFGAGVLPDDPAERDRVLIRAIGGGDPYGSEIDGLGGATSSTSKAVIVSPSDRAGYDVDYLFAQVGITAVAVDWTGSCGNLAAAVGPFAIEEGMVPAAGGLTTVRIWQQNTSKAIVAHVPTQAGRVVTEGDFRIDGVPYPAAKIRLDFVDPGGSMTGRLLPSGNVVDELEVPGVGSVTATPQTRACSWPLRTWDAPGPSCQASSTGTARSWLASRRSGPARPWRWAWRPASRKPRAIIRPIRKWRW
jgi:2-methylaconitate cis-trans-isomerase PrpF